MRSLAALLVCLSLGCKSVQPDAPRVPTSGGYSVTTTTGKSDASVALDATTPIPRDASTDAGFGVLPTECHNVALATTPGENPSTGRYVNGASEPPDFMVTRTVGTYEPDCLAPTVRLSLSDGKCPGGLGQELTIDLDAAALNDHRIAVGQNPIEAETAASTIRVRYLRPRSLSMAGEYGSCDTSTSGGITFRDPRLGTGPQAHFEALFQFFLPPCDGSDNAAIQVLGSFDIPMQRSLAQACP